VDHETLLTEDDTKLKKLPFVVEALDGSTLFLSFSNEQDLEDVCIHGIPTPHHSR
jgi:hypothetical protein